MRPPVPRSVAASEGLRSPAIRLALILAGLACACSSEPPPNVIFIVVDTLRADHAHSEEGLVSTPAFDTLASDGISFPLAFSHAPVTLPSHAALFSSRPPGEASVLRNGQPVDGELPLLPGWLEKRGYETHAVVSLATLWPSSKGRGLDRGFDAFERERAPIVRGEVVHGYIDRALNGLEEPFFLFAHYSDPHEPYDGAGFADRRVDLHINGTLRGTVASSPWTHMTFDLPLQPGVTELELTSDDPFKLRTARVFEKGGDLPLEWVEGTLQVQTRRALLRVENPDDSVLETQMELWLHDVPGDDGIAERYAREAENADRAVGQLIAALKRRGLYDDTLIVFTSDHGEALGEHGMIGHAKTLFDELLHVPLVIKPPVEEPPEEESAEPVPTVRERLSNARPHIVRHVDVVPTVLEILGLPDLPGQRGGSLFDARPRLLVAETHTPDADETQIALRDAYRKLVFFPDSDRFELYDLVRDPDELADVFAEQAEEMREWQRLLRRIAELGDDDGAKRTDEVDSLLRSLGY